MTAAGPKIVTLTEQKGQRIRLIAKDGTVVICEPFCTVELDMTKAPWTYVPETGEPS